MWQPDERLEDLSFKINAWNHSEQKYIIRCNMKVFILTGFILFFICISSHDMELWPKSNQNKCSMLHYGKSCRHTHTHTQCETHLFQHNYRLISYCNSFTILSQHFTSHRMSFLFSCHWPNFWTWLKSKFDSSSLLLISIAAQWRLINLVHRWLCTQLQKSLNK